LSLRRIDDPTARIRFGESIRIEIAARLNGLSPGDVLVEMLISHQHNHHGDHASFKLEFQGLAGCKNIFSPWI
jgi:starch phosphorylase